MPVTIAAEPGVDALPAYGPMPYTFTANRLAAGAGEPEPILEIEVSINGQTQGSSKYPALLRKFDWVLSPNVYTTYVWEYDVQGVVQNYFANESFFVAPGLGGIFSAANWQAQISLTVWLWVYDPATESLAREPNPSYTTTATGLNATANTFEPKQLDAFRGNAISLARYLTNKPNSVEIGYNSSEWLGFISENVSGVEFRFYGFDGALRGLGQIAMPANTPFREEVVQAAVGPSQINAMQTSDWHFTSGNVTVDENVWYYVVVAGAMPNVGLTTPYFQTKKFFPTDLYRETYRLHFLNAFGCVDSVSVLDISSERKSIASEAFLEGLTGARTSRSRGYSRRAVVGTHELSLRLQNLSPEETAWLNELARSANAYVEIDGSLYALIIEDTNFEPVQNERGLRNIEFSATLAVPEIAQQN